MSYGFEWMPAVVLVGAFVVLMVPAFALIGLAIVVLAALVALVALAGAILASPYLLVRTLRRRLAERHQQTQRTVPIGTAVAHPS
jgi:positive regulator of sigma E activity